MCCLCCCCFSIFMWLLLLITRLPWAPSLSFWTFVAPATIATIVMSIKKIIAMQPKLWMAWWWQWQFSQISGVGSRSLPTSPLCFIQLNDEHRCTHQRSLTNSTIISIVFSMVSMLMIMMVMVMMVMTLMASSSACWWSWLFNWVNSWCKVWSKAGKWRFRWGNNVQRPASETRGVGGDPLVRMEVGKCLLHLLVERLLFTLVFLSQ